MLFTVLASAAAYYVGLFFFIDATIERVDALTVDAPGILSPQAQEEADNFLIVGTETAGSDVAVTSALIAHLVPGGDGAVLVSLPLTAFTDVPACPRAGESRPAEPYGGSLASSYDTAGANCLVRSVQQLTGMRMNHYVELDLERLPGMAAALGGVPVCVPAEVATGGPSPVPAGASVLDAEQVRAILGEGDADQDPTGQLATDRHRLLLASTLREALRVENLANPFVVTGFVNEAANGLTLDQGTTLGALKDIGDKLGEFTEGDTVQTSVPLAQVQYQPVNSEQSYALVDDLASRALFRAIISDTELPIPAGEAAGPEGTSVPSTETETPEPVVDNPPPSETLTVTPQQITVNVFNGMGTPGLASGAATALAAQGFGVAEVENQVTGAAESVVRYGPGQLEAARTVAAAIPSSVLQEGATTGGLIDVVVGSSFVGVVPVVIAAPESPALTPEATEQPVVAARQSC